MIWVLIHQVPFCTQHKLTEFYSIQVCYTKETENVLRVKRYEQHFRVLAPWHPSCGSVKAGLRYE